MTLNPGARLGPYEIQSAIGAGGMGEVYKAKDTRLDRSVAIKVLPAHVSADPDRRARFEREAKTIAGLSHPHICALYDVGEHEGSAFLVMEHLTGETLAQRLENGPLPVEQALTVATEIADALATAHRQGVVHRDLKPGNVMLTKAGAKLLDFGLAKLKTPAPDSAGLSSLPTQKPTTVQGTILGTVPYMAPEQLEGMDADVRTDLWALGCVLYEMLTGRRAFQGQSTISTITAVTRDEPKPLRELVKGVPPEAERIVQRCLRKSREQRYASASEVERALENCRSLTSASTTGISVRTLLRKSRRPSVVIPGLALLLLVGSLSGWWLLRSSRVRWARTQALPQIAQFIEQEEWGEAYALAVQAAGYIPDDPMLGKFWPRMSWTASIRTTPADAVVLRRSYGARDGTWEVVGRSPIEKHRFPLVDSQWRFELKGFAAVERATMVFWGEMFPPSLSVTMEMEAEAPTEMVHQTDALTASYHIRSLENTPATLVGFPGFEDSPGVRMRDYWIDRFEVTNQQFKQFLDQGGYRKQEYWKHEFRKDGRALPWAEAMVLFRDTTGRPGPSTWVQGEYPRGQEDFPVAGVSWYEAAAYAEFVGKTLPTIYHWATAASPWTSASILPASNFGGQAPARVGRFRGMSWSGAYDMGGNVKEWSWNEAGSGRRYILGGAWDEPPYMFNDPDARSPFERSANFGFRCAKYGSGDTVGKAGDPVLLSARDFNREQPVPDALFQVYKSLYSYDKTPLRAAVESVEETDDWKREKITFAAAYGNERVIAYLFLPKKSQPPFQTVVRFPGSETIDIRSSVTLPEMGFVDFIIKSGRAVMFPVYKGTFERGDDLKSDCPNMTSSWRDHVIAWSKDLGRSIDYLETRPEINRNKLAYEGVTEACIINGTMVPSGA